MVLLCNSALKKGKQKGRVDEADISSLLLEMHLASCGLDGQHQLSSEMLEWSYLQAY